MPSGPSRQSGSDDEQNPFVAFRKFADEQISFMLQNFVGLPSAFEQPGQGRWTTYDDWMRRSVGDWSGCGAHPERSEHRHGPNSYPSQCSDRELNTAKWSFPFSPPEDTFTRPDLPFRPSWDVWLSHYLYGNPYCPERLKDDSRLREHKDWHRAFEDLLAAQAGLNMNQIDASKKSAVDRAPISDVWRINVFERFRAHPPNPFEVPSLRRTFHSTLQDPPVLATAAPENHAPVEGKQEDDTESGEPSSELEMYERFLSSCPASPLRREEGQGNKEEKAAQRVATSSFSSSLDTRAAEKEGPSVVSTLTTTEKVTLPDGTTTTKVVLKRRFADGREESNETVHTTKGNAFASLSSEPTPLPEDKKGAENQNENAKEKKGWFWY